LIFVPAVGSPAGGAHQGRMIKDDVMSVDV
jgi:hypothetical protein